MPGCSRFPGRLEHTCGMSAQQEDSVGFELLNTRVSRGAGSTTELSPTPDVTTYKWIYMI